MGNTKSKIKLSPGCQGSKSIVKRVVRKAPNIKIRNAKFLNKYDYTA